MREALVEIAAGVHLGAARIDPVEPGEATLAIGPVVDQIMEVQKPPGVDAYEPRLEGRAELMVDHAAVGAGQGKGVA